MRRSGQLSDDERLQLEELMKSHMLFFDKAVLAQYRAEPHKYSLTVNEFEGEVGIASSYSDLVPKGQGILIRFGYKTLTSGETCLAVVFHDFEQYSVGHIDRWKPHRVSKDLLSPLPDPVFEEWAARYVFGSWEVDNSYVERIELLVERINAVTTEALGGPLFGSAKNPHLMAPTSQSDHAYQDAHRELYAFLMDGLQRETIDLLFPITGAAQKGKWPRQRLQAALPGTGSSILWTVLDLVSHQRGLATHNVRPAAQSFDAFAHFAADLARTDEGLRDLLLELERVLGVDGERAKARLDAIPYLPKIDRPMVNALGVSDLHSIIGRTVSKIEYGLSVVTEDAHRSDVVYIHFTDGSVVGLDTGSNACNVSWDHGDFPPNAFDVYFVAKFIPPPQVRPARQ